MDIGNFASGTDSMDSDDAEIENHERQLEQTLLEQLKIAKSVAEAKQFCTTDLDDWFLWIKDINKSNFY